MITRTTQTTNSLSTLRGTSIFLAAATSGIGVGALIVLLGASALLGVVAGGAVAAACVTLLAGRNADGRNTSVTQEPVPAATRELVHH